MKHLVLLETNQAMLYEDGTSKYRNTEMYTLSKEISKETWAYNCNFASSLLKVCYVALVGLDSFIDGYFKDALSIASIYELNFINWE